MSKPTWTDKWKQKTRYNWYKWFWKWPFLLRYQQFGCKTCGQTFENDEDLTEHEMQGTCDFGCEHCGAYFIDNYHLNLHLRRHCITYYEEYQPKGVLEAHKKICKGIQYWQIHWKIDR